MSRTLRHHAKEMDRWWWWIRISFKDEDVGSGPHDGGGSEYPSTMKMSGVAPIKGGRKKSQRTRVQPCTHPSWTENILENEERGETTDTYKKR